jgi:branched-chain amino acid transport system permease protein
MRPFQILKWVLIPLLLILLMQFRPEGFMGNRELSDFIPSLKAGRIVKRGTKDGGHGSS